MIEKMSRHDFIKHKISINAGSGAGIEAPCIKEIAEFCTCKGIEIEKRETKHSMIQKIYQHGISDDELYNYFVQFMGLQSINFQKKFRVEHKTIKKLEKKGMLKVAHTSQVRMYGKYVQVPMYEADVYFKEDEFEKLLKQLEVKRKV